MKCKTCGIILKKHSHKFVCYRELTILGRCHYKKDGYQCPECGKKDLKVEGENS